MTAGVLVVDVVGETEVNDSLETSDSYRVCPAEALYVMHRLIFKILLKVILVNKN